MEDGGALFDSRVIVEYLDTLTPVAKLIPPERPRARRSPHVGSAGRWCIDAAILVRLERSQRPPEQQSEQWVDRQMHKVRRGHRIDGSRLWRTSLGATAMHIRWPISRWDARSDI